MARDTRFEAVLPDPGMAFYQKAITWENRQRDQEYGEQLSNTQGQ